MNPGDRVLFVADWSSFRGMRGRVLETHPHLMVAMDDDPSRPIRVGEREVVAVIEDPHHAGAE